MSVATNASLAVANFCLAMAKLETFATDMLWKRYSKFNLDQLIYIAAKR